VCRLLDWFWPAQVEDQLANATNAHHAQAHGGVVHDSVHWATLQVDWFAVGCLKIDRNVDMGATEFIGSIPESASGCSSTVCSLRGCCFHGGLTSAVGELQHELRSVEENP
jgi:hypothetical protein